MENIPHYSFTLFILLKTVVSLKKLLQYSSTSWKLAGPELCFQPAVQGSALPYGSYDLQKRRTSPRSTLRCVQAQRLFPVHHIPRQQMLPRSNCCSHFNLLVISAPPDHLALRLTGLYILASHFISYRAG